MTTSDEPRRYRLGHYYRDKGSTNDPGDQFLRWLNLDGTGMRNMGGVRYHNFQTLKPGVPAFIVLVTTEPSQGSHANPWEDQVDLAHGRITYWGDAKFHEEKGVDDWPGNKALLSAYERILDNVRDLIPPILHFSRPESGILKFNGLAVLDRLELTWFEHKDHQVRNFRLSLSILDEEYVDVAWLHARKAANDRASLLGLGPSSWQRYQRASVVDRLKIWAPSLRSRDEQLPAPASRDERVLRQVIGLSPVQFEAAVVKVFEEMRDVTHTVTRTRHVVDGGFDFFGSFRMPPPLGYEIDFLGEAKRYELTNSVGPKDVSRLVARLGRGDYGLFVTTSYFTKQAQEEVLEDGYPVRLFAGADLVGAMRELRITRGDELAPAWLRAVEEEAERRLA